MNYKLVVDSCCELTPELKEALCIGVVPLTMSLGDEDFIDNEELDVDAFLKRMNDYSGCPRSSCPSPAAYDDQFSGAKSIFAVTISSELSGSYSSAMVAKGMAEERGEQVHIFDSKSASAGELLISLKIKELIDLKLNNTQIIGKIEHFIQNMKTFFVLENLENLIKNGRMNKVVGHIANVLQIRTVLGADNEGHIAYVSKAAGTKLAVKKLAELIGKHCTDTVGRTLVITHCNNEKHAFSLKKMVQDMYSFQEILLVKTGGLSSMYANNGGIIIAF